MPRDPDSWGALLIGVGALLALITTYITCDGDRHAAERATGPTRTPWIAPSDGGYHATSDGLPISRCADGTHRTLTDCVRAGEVRPPSNPASATRARVRTEAHCG